ncbi:accessory Sec system S-layer assembly protein [Alkalihalophilus pseudofirmus]|uniref:Accessory Sec system S-layer assembly protein n=1 Tax=Alkalihalophilus pseudofirmus TaxID=79885 RepID=A0AAJ2U185_ALKPS|nr:accessory Sec system S-layer assembly protein [Alkalihalophilus pseudofirmus]MDV2886334.1 accessory Sec system S-layer assembly protein [Alkalihalophilus pseudofirmus]
MLSFFRKREDGTNPELEGAESSVAPSELGQEEGGNKGNQDEVYTELSFPPAWNVSKEDKYAFQFLNGECAPLKPNQISLSGIEIQRDEIDKKVTVKAFIRSSLDKPVKFEKTTLVLIGHDGTVLGRKEFDLSQIGELPPKSSRPWLFEFDAKDMLKVDLPRFGWKLAFQLNKEEKHELELDPSWDKSLDSQAKEKLVKMVEDLPSLQSDEVNFMGLQAKKKEDGSLHVTMLIRNGSKKNLNLEQLPLYVEDASGDVVAKGGFKLDSFIVRANTSKPWSFIFPKEMIVKEELDLSRWKAYAPKK